MQKVRGGRGPRFSNRRETRATFHGWIAFENLPSPLCQFGTSHLILESQATQRTNLFLFTRTNTYSSGIFRCELRVPPQRQQNLSGNVLFFQRNGHLFCAVFPKRAVTTAPYDEQPQSCLKFAREIPFWPHEKPFWPTSKPARESEDTHGLNINEMKTCPSGFAVLKHQRGHTRRRGLRFGTQIPQLLTRSKTSPIRHLLRHAGRKLISSISCQYLSLNHEPNLKRCPENLAELRDQDNLNERSRCVTRQ